MPRTIESIAENHRVATERRKAGKPAWDRHLTIKHLLTGDDSDENAQEIGRKIAAILRASAWLKADKEENDERLGGSEVEQIAEDFEDIEDLDHFNLVLDGLYDLADADRVWIA